MILECEKCATRYLVDTADIGVLGRMVRCAECGHDWFATTDGAKPSPQAAPVQEPEPEPAPEVEVAATDAAAEEEAPTGSTNLPAIVPETHDRQAQLVLGIGAMVLALLVLYLIFGRAQIMSAWPPAQHAFAVLGLEEPVAAPVSPAGDEGLAPALFALQDMAIERVGSTITLTGQILNEGGMAGPLPSLNISEYDVDGNVVAVTITQLEGGFTELPPGEILPLNLVHGLAGDAVTRIRVGIATGEEVSP